MQRYDPAAVEAKWQKVWDDAEAFITPNPEPGEDASRLQYVLEMLPVPLGRPAHGARQELHDRRRALPSAPPPRPARAAPDGLRRVRPARRERRDPRGPPPARRHGREHRRDPQADEAHGLVDRLVARALDRRARVLPLDAVDLPAAVRARPGLQARGAGQLVPGRPDGARQRAGHRRSLRALRRPVESRVLAQWYFKITDYAQRLLDDMALLEDWPERVLAMQRNWIGRSEGAEVLFQQRDLDETSRSSRRAPTRSSARRSSSWRPSTR